MEKIKVIFKTSFSSEEFEYICNLKDEILNTFQESAKKLNKEFSELTYLSGGRKINFSKDITFEDISNSTLESNINVLILDIQPPDVQINMMISEDYIPEWGFKEGLREFLQNQHDGIINYALKEDNLVIKGIGDKYKDNDNPEDFEKFLNFEFFNKNDNEKLGEIIYDEKLKILTIINKGKLVMGNLVLGSKKEKKNNNEIIGQFGEGMKLAILSLLRKNEKNENKNINIISSDKNFAFELCKGSFEEENESRILYCNLSKYKKYDMENKVKVEISNITKNEWNDEIYKYLWLLDRVNLKIYLSEKEGEKIGEILAEPIFENKLYCKGIYVQNIEKGKNDELKSKQIPGFNVYELKLDRDRNCVQDTYEMKKKFGEIWVYGLKTNKTYSNNSNYIITENKIDDTKEEKKLAKTDSYIYDIDYSEIVYVSDYGNEYLSEKLISLMSDKDISFTQDYFFNSSFLYSINKYEADQLWRTWEKMNNIEHRDPPKYQPLDSENIQKLGKFFEKNKLNKNFYLFYEVSKPLMKLLQKSSLYLGYEEKFKKYMLKSPNVERTSKIINYLDILEKKVKIPNFNKDFVSFKKLDFGSDSYYYDDIKKKLFFSHLKLNELDNIKTKYWMFTIILKAMDIQIENSYRLYKNFFAYIKK